MLGAFAALTGFDITELETQLHGCWEGKRREGNLAAARWAHDHVRSLTHFGLAAEVA